MMVTMTTTTATTNAANTETTEIATTEAADPSAMGDLTMTKSAGGSDAPPKAPTAAPTDGKPVFGGDDDGFVPYTAGRHSDFTVHTSNVGIDGQPVTAATTTTVTTSRTQAAVSNPVLTSTATDTMVPLAGSSSSASLSAAPAPPTTLAANISGFRSAHSSMTELVTNTHPEAPGISHHGNISSNTMAQSNNKTGDTGGQYSDETSPPRRNIFGSTVDNKYNITQSQQLQQRQAKFFQAQQQQQQMLQIQQFPNFDDYEDSERSDFLYARNHASMQMSEITLPPEFSTDHHDTDENHNGGGNNRSSKWRSYFSGSYGAIKSGKGSRKQRSRVSNDNTLSPTLQVSPLPRKKRAQQPHETIHAQSLMLGLAFSAVWSPSNLMAPNLTDMAESFGFDNAERDLYLGSYCALATGVLSFPIAAGIGILADLVNRKYLFVVTVMGGALSSFVTGRARNYYALLFARFLNGGFMSGSTPVAFSFLGDLFAVEERNAASSGLTAMMGVGIVLGQVYAGVVGASLGWDHPFYVSSAVTFLAAILCLLFVQEPLRGGKERVLQDMIRAGTRYERKLSWEGFWHAVRHNPSNAILLWQGFFSSLPWGIIFVFLNDYLSQERGLSVPTATYLVLMFGIGCALGGVLGGYWGQLVQSKDRSYLPLFMALTTELGILPFLALLNVNIPNPKGLLGVLIAALSGLIPSLPSVNVRPCLINVNPPETRGAALTAANLLINLGRGIGPSCVTVLGTMFNVDRQLALNLNLALFWTVSCVQLVLLSRTLPTDQDKMEAELAKYAAKAIEEAARDNEAKDTASPLPVVLGTSNPSLFKPYPLVESSSTFSIPGVAGDEVSIEDRMTYFDGTAARQTINYVKQGVKEFQHEVGNMYLCKTCSATEILESSSDEESPLVSPNSVTHKEAQVWRTQNDSLDKDAGLLPSALGRPNILPTVPSLDTSEGESTPLLT